MSHCQPARTNPSFPFLLTRPWGPGLASGFGLSSRPPPGQHLTPAGSAAVFPTAGARARSRRRRDGGPRFPATSHAVARVMAVRAWPILGSDNFSAAADPCSAPLAARQEPHLHSRLRAVDARTTRLDRERIGSGRGPPLPRTPQGSRWCRRGRAHPGSSGALADARAHPQRPVGDLSGVVQAVVLVFLVKILASALCQKTHLSTPGDSAPSPPCSSRCPARSWRGPA